MHGAGEVSGPADREPRLTSLLRPRSIAILGVSSTRFASANQVLANLRARNYSGKLSVVSRHRIADDVPTYPEIDQLPRGIDVALVSLPASGVMDALVRLEKVNCRSAIVPSIGFGQQDVARYREFSQPGRMSVHGPNSMGVLNYTDDIPLWFFANSLIDESAGGVALVAQSGSACMAIARSVTSGSFSKVVSSGDELAVTTADYLSWLADDPATDMAALVIESIADVGKFVAAVAKMRQAGKPVVVLKVGRTETGSRATIAHTGAMIGRHEGYVSLFKSLDLPLVDDYDELASAIECLSRRVASPVHSHGVAVITASGGQGALAADLAEAKGVTLSEFSTDTIETLHRVLPGATAANPLDALANVGTDGPGFYEAVRIVANDPKVGSLLVILDLQRTLNAAEVDWEKQYFDSVVGAPSGYGKPVVIASSSAEGIHPAFLGESGLRLPVVRGVGNGLVALRCLAMNSRPTATSASQEATMIQSSLIEATTVAARQPGPISAQTTERLLTTYGIEMARSELISDPAEAEAAAHRIGYPVVVKVVSRDVPHRSDVGGVVKDVSTAKSLRQAMRSIRKSVASYRPGAEIEAFEIQEQLASGIEAMAGFVRDPIFGAIVLVGLGGTLVELIEDRGFGLAPLDEEAAMILISQTRLQRVADGYRNLAPPTTLRPLALVVSRLSRIAADFRGTLTEGDLNPLIIEYGSGRVRAVDALFVAAG